MLFRPPYGVHDKRLWSVVEGAGYRILMWDVDSWDAWKAGITSAEIQERVLDRAKPGYVVLMHCGSPATAEALQGIIDGLSKRGLEIVTVSGL